MGEARAVLLAIRSAVEEGLSNIKVEGDSQVVISAFINQEQPLEWQLDPFIFEARQLLHAILVWFFYKILCSAN